MKVFNLETEKESTDDKYANTETFNLQNRLAISLKCTQNVVTIEVAFAGVAMNE